MASQNVPDTAHIETCGDEKTGCRYAKARPGKCAKIGGGGRNRRNWNAYQLWAVWE